MANYTLQLLHYSDAEAGLLAADTAPNLAALVDAFDGQVANTLILLGGDDFIPGPFLAAGTDLSVKPALNAQSGSTISASTAVNIPVGAVDIAIHNAIGVQASTIGNHEFDLGSRVLRDAFSPNLGAAGWVGANFPYLSANLDFSGDADLAPRFTNTVGNGATPTPEAGTLKGRIAPAAVVTINGERIGLIGATTQVLESISSPTGTEVKGFPTGPGANGEVDNMTLLASQLQPIIDEMTAEGITKIIVQSHLQLLDNERALATRLHGVDIILSAGSHSRIADANDQLVAFPGHDANKVDTYPIVTQGTDGKATLIVVTDNEYTYLGRLVVDFDANGDLVASSVAANASINGVYASTAQNVATAWGTTVANLATTAFADGTKGDKVEKLVGAVDNVIQVKDGQVFGFSNVYLEGDRAIIRNEETNLGDLSADANGFVARSALNTPFVVSLKNGGGVRAQIGGISDPDPVTGKIAKLPTDANPDAGKPEGGVSQLDIENSLRFNNRLMVYDTTPQGLLNILNWGAGRPANDGGFPQIGGVRYSYDPSLPGDVGQTPGSRIRDMALVDENGHVIANLVDNGVVLPGAPQVISVVTLNFTANGGDGYPVKENADNFRFLLDNGTLSAPVSEALDFTATGVVPANAMGEQQAFATYLSVFHATQANAYDQTDTPQTGDLRIQNIAVRGDTALGGVVGRPVDFNGDGVDDLLWQNSDGSVSAWVSSNGRPVPPSGPTGSAPFSTALAGTGDFNGDGKSDVLFRGADGHLVTWTMNGGQIQAITDIGSTSPGFRVAGTGDFNGDRTDDVLFRSLEGQVVTWSMQNGRIASIQTAGSADQSWHIQGTGDFNGDGRTDILWRDDDGHIVDWLMQNGRVSGVVTPGSAPGSAHVAATGDFNGDGTTDILFRANDGHVTAWLMNAGRVASVVEVGSADLSWHIQATGDINGNGADDILWQNDNGTAVDWLMNAGRLVSIQDLGHTPATTHMGGSLFDTL